MLSTPDSRRRLLAFLATLPVVGGLLSIVSLEDAEGKGSRKRRKKRHKHGKGRRRKHSRKKRCKPESVAQTCAGKCGSVANNCKKPVGCGSCACEPSCEACFVCQDQGPNTSSICVVDPAQQGAACGDPGQIYLADGTCACAAGSCTPPQTCRGGGVAGSCGCTPTTCAAEVANCGKIDDGCRVRLLAVALARVQGPWSRAGGCSPPPALGNSLSG